MRKEMVGNILYVFWFMFYFLITWLIFGASLQAFKIVGIIYGVCLLLAFTPIAEGIFRYLQGIKPVSTVRAIMRLETAFNQSYQYAKDINPRLSDNIELCIKESMEINAFAMGRHTLAITKGAIELLTEEELMGILAHEFGHFSNADTFASLVLYVGNLLFNLLYNAFKFIANILHKYFVTFRDTNLIKYIWGVVNFIVKAIGLVGDLILMPISRRHEYLADKFAFEIGLGHQLTEALYKLNMVLEEEPRRITDFIKKTHPSLTDRITRLESYDTKYLISEES